MRPARPPHAPTERPVRWGLGLGVLLAHGLVMALALRGGGDGDARRLPPRASDQPALVYVNTPPLALDAPAPALRRDGPARASAGQPAPQKPLPPAATGPLAPGPAAPSLLLALAPTRAAAPASTATAVAEPAHAPSAASAATAPALAVAAAAAVPPAQPPRALPGNALPAYPEAAREDGLHGTVQLQVLLDAQGRVTAVHWLRRSGVMLLDLAARDAVQAWRFEPARRGGEAVAGSLSLSIRFQLDAPVSASALASTAP